MLVVQYNVAIKCGNRNTRRILLYELEGRNSKFLISPLPALDSITRNSGAKRVARSRFARPYVGRDRDSALGSVVISKVRAICRYVTYITETEEYLNFEQTLISNVELRCY